MFGLVKKAYLEAEIEKSKALYKSLKKEEDSASNLRINLEESERRYVELTNSELYKRLENYERFQIELTKLKYQVEKETSFVNDFKDSELRKAQHEIDAYVKKKKSDATKESEELIRNLEKKTLKSQEKFEIYQGELIKLKAQSEEEIKLVNEFKDSEIKKSRHEIDVNLKKAKSDAEKEAEEFTRNLEVEISKVREDLEKNKRDLSENSKFFSEASERLDKKTKELKKIEINIEVQDELNTVRPVTQEIDGVNSSEIKQKIDINKDMQKEVIRSGKAWDSYKHYYLDNSLSAGKSQQRRLGKFLLTAFNAQADSIISLAKKNNFHNCHTKIEKWFEKINKLGEDHHIVIERRYLKLRLEELRIVVEYHLQKEFEKEEQRYINESIREEKRVQKEIESFVKSREKEENNYKAEIDRATKELKASSEAEVAKLTLLIDDLQLKLERSVKEKERAMSMAQLTRSGHVYIISNEGSFGHGVYKIGMTRRLDPMDRVKELGGASVPFFFDVHGIIHSDDAPRLERELHKRFEAFRVNKENYRREFFRVSIEEIENEICKIHGQMSLGRLALNEEPEEGAFQDED